MLPDEIIQSVLDEPERPLPPPGNQKLTGWELFRKVFKSPKCVVAPMVDQSELPWRILSRLHGFGLVYTPMINARLFNADVNPIYVREQFDVSTNEGGNATLDRPLVVQFCANDPHEFLRAATMLADAGVCDAVDLNLGCPQGIAKRGHYGAFLMEDWALIESLIHHLHVNLSVPITAKFRVYDTTERTLAYAKMLEKAGAQIITCHGRTREQKGQLTGLADWDKVKAVKQAVTSIPVFANGNILVGADVDDCLAYTGCDSVMSAEGNLYNPGLIDDASQPGLQYLQGLPEDLQSALSSVTGLKVEPSLDDFGFPDAIATARRYLTIVRWLKTPTASSAIRSHLFKLFHGFFGDERYHDCRAKLAECGGSPETAVGAFLAYVDHLASLAQADLHAFGNAAQEARQQLQNGQRVSKYPLNVCQPHFRKLVASTPTEGLKRSAEGEAEAEPVKKPRLETTPCISSGCINYAAGRCSRRACKDCCKKLGQEDNQLCESHQAKESKKSDKRAQKAAFRASKKAKAQAQPPKEAGIDEVQKVVMTSGCGT